MRLAFFNNISNISSMFFICLFISLNSLFNFTTDVRIDWVCSWTTSDTLCKKKHKKRGFTQLSYYIRSMNGALLSLSVVLNSIFSGREQWLKNWSPNTVSVLFTYFLPLFSFYTPWTHQKSRSFPMFSGNSKRDH